MFSSSKWTDSQFSRAPDLGEVGWGEVSGGDPEDVWREEQVSPGDLLDVDC